VCVCERESVCGRVKERERKREGEKRKREGGGCEVGVVEAWRQQGGSVRVRVFEGGREEKRERGRKKERAPRVPPPSALPFGFRIQV